MKSSVASRLTHSELGSSPPQAELNFKVYPSDFYTRNALLAGFAFYISTPLHNIWSRQNETRTAKSELELTPRHAGRHAAHQSHTAGMDTSVCLDFHGNLMKQMNGTTGKQSEISTMQ